MCVCVCVCAWCHYIQCVHAITVYVFLCLLPVLRILLCVVWCVCADPTGAEKLPRDKQRVLMFKEKVPDLHHMPAAEVAKLLADSIIFENGTVVQSTWT